MNSIQGVATIEFGNVKLTAPASTIARAVLDSVFGSSPQIVAPGAAPAIGAPWPGQGGVNAGLMRGELGLPDYYVIVATAAEAAYKGEYDGTTKVAGALSHRDGRANTTAMWDAGSPIARHAHEVHIEGHRDFYIPARHELRLCYLTVPELFAKDGWYWTSTQYEPDDDCAWYQDFDDGTQLSDLKSAQGLVRLVRRVILR